MSRGFQKNDAGEWEPFDDDFTEDRPMTPTPTIERVARAICESERMNPDDALGGWIHWQNAARAAIEAMRWSTEVMRHVGGPIIYRHDPDYDLQADTAQRVWSAMIDAALGRGGV